MLILCPGRGPEPENVQQGPGKHGLEVQPIGSDETPSMALTELRRLSVPQPPITLLRLADPALSRTRVPAALSTLDGLCCQLPRPHLVEPCAGSSPHFSHWAELGSLTVSPSATACPLHSLRVPFGHYMSLQSLHVPFGHWVSPLVTTCPLQSLHVPFSHYSSPSVTTCPFSHCMSPSVTVHPLRSLGLPFGHCMSPSVTACPLQSLRVPFGHWVSPSVTACPLWSLRVPFRH